MLRFRKKLLRLYQHIFIKYRIIKAIPVYQYPDTSTVVFGEYQPAGALKQLRYIKQARNAARGKES